MSVSSATSVGSATDSISSFTYSPTPLESAYTSYLLEAVFDLPAAAVDNNNNYSQQQHGVIRISGREGVTFLSKSGVHRLILRNIWTAVDPSQIGTLQHRSQLSTLLRAVALAQNPNNNNNNNSNSGTDTSNATPSLLQQSLSQAFQQGSSPVTAVLTCLRETAHRTDIPLAQFDGIPLPDEATLKPYMPATTAAMPAVTQQQPQNGGWNKTMDNGMGGGAPMMMAMSQQPAMSTNTNNAMFSPAPPPQQQQLPANDSSSWNAPAATSMMPQSMKATTTLNNHYSSTIPNTMMGPTTGASSGWGALDALATTTSNPTPTPAPATNNSYGDFGNSLQSSMPSPVQVTGWGNAPMPAGGGGPPPASTMDAFGDFGSSAAAPAPAPQPASSGWDALDALASTSVPTNSVPPPLSMMGSGGGDAGAPPAVPQSSQTMQQDDEQADFGDFASSSSAQQAVSAAEWNASGVPGSSTQQTFGGATAGSTMNNNDFGGFGSGTMSMSQQQQSTLEPSGWDALDALALTAPAPAPSLQSREMTTPSTSNGDEPPHNEEAEDDDFGDFASSAPTPAPQQTGMSTSWDTNNTADTSRGSMPQSQESVGIGPPQDNYSTRTDDNQFGSFGGSMPQFQTQSTPEPSGWDALDALASSATVPPPALPAAETTTNTVAEDTPRDDFGNFASSAVSETPDKTNAPMESTGWGALDSLSTSAPVLSPSSPSVEATAKAAGTPNDDDFEGFSSSGVDDALYQNNPPVATTGWDALDALASPAPAPPPSLPSAEAASQITTVEASNDDNDDDFGGFTSSGPTESPHPGAATAEWGALDALPADYMPSTTEGASLAAAAPKVADDDFGGFTSTAEAPASSGDTLIDSSGWGALDALAETSSVVHRAVDRGGSAVANPNLGSGQSQQSPADDFGTFGRSTSLGPSQLDTSMPDKLTNAPNGASGWDALGFMDSKDDSLSGFSSSMAETKQQGHMDSASGWDALNALAATHAVAPLGASMAHKTDEDDFGDFTSTKLQNDVAEPPQEATDGIQNSVPSMEATSAANNSAPAGSFEDDEFGDFEATSAPTSLSLPTPHITEHTGSAPGDVDPPAIVTNADSSSVSGRGPLDASASASPPNGEDLTRTVSAVSGISVSSSEDVLRNLSSIPQSSVGKLERSTSMSTPPPEKKAISTVRSDSAFFSARQSSLGIQSDVSSIDGYADALQNPQGDTISAAMHDQDDPFAAFDTLAPPQPQVAPLPSFDRRESVAGASHDSLPQHEEERPISSLQDTNIQTKAESGDDDLDDFGDFEGVETTTEGNNVEEADFGGFAAAPANSQTEENVNSTQPQTDVDLFGDFAASQAVSPPAVPNDGDLFDAFSSGAATTSTGPTDAGGDFGEFAYSSPVTLNDDDFGDLKETATTPNNDDDDFGNFASTGPAATTDFGDSKNPAPAVQDDDDDFCDFASTTAAPDSGHGATVDAAVPVQTDDFGNFASTGPSIPSDDDFGGFGGFESAGSASIPLPDDLGHKPVNSAETDNQSSDFKDTQSDISFDFDAVPTHNALSDDSGDEWDAFEEAAQKPLPKSNDPETEYLLKIREFVLSAAMHVPESLLQRAGGGHVDFATCFEANIGVDVPVSTERKKRMQRCLQVATLLSSERSKLASAYWSAAISCARDELTLGCNLCQEAGKLTNKECASAVGPFQTYVHGLGEVVRVVRMIVATVGDLLMLDSTSLLTVDTFSSSWCSLAVLKEAIEIERLWKELSDESLKLGIKPKDETNSKLVSIAELRATSCITTADQDSLCQFTLQPFVQGSETTTQIEWGNRNFMACTANFLANKCTFFSLDD